MARWMRSFTRTAWASERSKMTASQFTRAICSRTLLLPAARLPALR
jgi:hypothetical protein